MGPRAAEKINASHCELEDRYNALLEEARALQAFGMQSVATMNALAPHIARYQEMENLLTDPDRLAAYTVDFFTHVHPTPSSAEMAQMQGQHPALPPAHHQQAIDLNSIAPEKRWMVADEMEKQGLFRGKQLIVS